MSNELKNIFHAFDRGLISRRQLLQALGVAAVIKPVSAFAQGSCGATGANGAANPKFGTPACNTTPAKLPFEATGWKTVLLDHFTIRVADHEKEAAYYQALLGWKIRSADDKEAMLDIGNWGGFKIIGGYTAPPPAANAGGGRGAGAAAAGGNATTGNAAGAATGAAAGGGAAGAGGRAGGGGGRGGGAPRNNQVTGFCWGIDNWDAKKVEAELKKRGLDPVPDNDPKTKFESFHVKDLGGFDLQISNGNMKNRRQTPATAKVGAAAPFEPTNWKTVWLDHISFEVADYKANVAFYQALLGWKPGIDEGSLSNVNIGDVGDILIRGGNALDPNFGRGRAGADGTPGPIQPPRPTGIGHISFGIAPWEVDAVRAELEKRGLSVQADSGNLKGPNFEADEKAMEAKLGHALTSLDRQVADMHGTKYQSYHTNTPNGFNLQISNCTKDTRDGIF